MPIDSITAPLLPASVASTPAPRDRKKIHDAAQQFEALLVGEMLRSAREESSEGWLGSGGSTGDDSAMDMAESQFANALSRSGGLGLAAMIERAMTRSGSDAQNTAQTLEAAGASSKPEP